MLPRVTQEVHNKELLHLSKGRMVANFCHPLSDYYVDMSDLYVVLSDLYVDLSDLYVNLSLIHMLENES